MPELWPYTTVWPSWTLWPHEPPGWVIEAAPGVNAADVPTDGDWEDWSDRLVEFSLRRGRNHEMDRMDVGRMTAQLRNNDRRLDPTENADIYPMMQVRIRATAEDYSLPLFYGYAEQLPQRANSIGSEIRVHLDLIDGMVLLNLADTDAVAPQEGSGARIGRLLDDAGWPSGLRDIDTGQSTVQAKTYDSESVLSAIREVAETEQGIFWIDGQGRAQFRERHDRILTQNDSAATFADDGTGFPYFDPEPTFDESQLWNRIRVEAPGLTAQTAEDSASIAQHLRRKKKVESLTVDENEMLALADWLLWRYKDARLRFDRITLHPSAYPDQAETVLGTDLGSRYTLVRNYETGSTVSEDVHVERISIKASAEAIYGTEVQWRLSPAARDTFWVLGDSNAGVLGETTRLAF